MDRILLLPDELLKDTDFDTFNKNVLISNAKLSEAIFGITTRLNGLDCLPTTPATMDVIVNPGEIYEYKNIDDTPYGSLPADTTHQILKQGIVLDAQTFNCPAPLTAGFSINYLIQVALIEQDTDSATRFFYDPTTPFGIPAIPETVNQTRQDLCSVQLKVGTPDITGTQITPTPDAGYIGAWVITINYGQTVINSGDISVYPNTTFINAKWDDFLTEPAADQRYAQISDVQVNSFNYSVSSGLVNQYQVALSPIVTSYYDGMLVYLRAAIANSGSSTLQVNALPPKTIYRSSNFNVNRTLLKGDILLNGDYVLIFNSVLNGFLLINPSCLNPIDIKYFQTATLATGTTTMSLFSTPTSTNGTQFMSLTVTPKDPDNILFIECRAMLGAVSDRATLMGAIFRDSDITAIASGFFSAARNLDTVENMVTINLPIVAGSTSATTFKFRGGSDQAGVCTFNGSNSLALMGGTIYSSIKITEYRNDNIF